MSITVAICDTGFLMNSRVHAGQVCRDCFRSNFFKHILKEHVKKPRNTGFYEKPIFHAAGARRQRKTDFVQLFVEKNA